MHASQRLVWWSSVALGAILLVGLAAARHAVAARVVEPGLYEGIDPRDGLPAGPIDTRAGSIDASVYVEWLEVTRTAAGDDTVYAIVFQPEGRIRWDMTVAAHGLTRKVTSVDGVVVHTSDFAYDAAGHVASKRVSFASGAAASGPTWTFVAAPDGRDRTRQDAVPPYRDQQLVVSPGGGFALRALDATGKVRRVDTFDAGGRRTRIALGEHGQVASVRFVRGPGGALRALERTFLATSDEQVMPLWGLDEGGSRADAWRLFGAPVHTSDEGQAGARRVHDDWAKSCWLNEISGLTFEADLSISGKSQGCICGLCVAAMSAPSGVDIEAVDTHMSPGPWVAIDGVLVTEGHLVATPSGARAAGLIAAGDSVLGADGRARVVAAVEHVGFLMLPAVNLRTASGTFTAGDLTLISEL